MSFIRRTVAKVLFYAGAAAMILGVFLMMASDVVDSSVFEGKMEQLDEDTCPACGDDL